MKRKPLNIVKVEYSDEWWDESTDDVVSLFYVYLHAAAVRTLPDWVRSLLVYHYGSEDRNSQLVFMGVRAEDEVQAYTRVQQLWAGLPRKEK